MKLAFFMELLLQSIINDHGPAQKYMLKLSNTGKRRNMFKATNRSQNNVTNAVLMSLLLTFR